MTASTRTGSINVKIPNDASVEGNADRLVNKMILELMTGVNMRTYKDKLQLSSPHC